MWDRGQGDTVASQSMLAISYTKAHGTQTQCSEENAGKYDRNDDTHLYCTSLQASVQLRATNAASMKAQWARAAHALHTQRFCAAHAPLTLAVWNGRETAESNEVPFQSVTPSHVGWPTKLGSRQRDQSTSSVTKRANGHWHAIIASSCRWSPCEYKRQQVHRINSSFRFGAERWCITTALYFGVAERTRVRALRQQQRWSRSRGYQVRADNTLGVCAGQLPCVLQHWKSKFSKRATRVIASF